MEIPTTVAHLESLIERQVQESLHLDYKASSALALTTEREIRVREFRASRFDKSGSRD